jgi:WD40 repeat protein
MASPDASGARGGETRAETAAQVTAAFRAAARARRGQHQKPVDVLRRAFASSCPGDGRASPEDFRVTATKLGLEIPVKDVLAVFETSEHVMRDDVGKENALAGEETPEADEAASERARSESSQSNPSPSSNPALLLYQPWIDAALGIPPPRPKRGALGVRSGSAPIKAPPSEPTRRGPLLEHDPLAKPEETFNYPQCRTPVFAPPGWSHHHVARGASLPSKALELDHVHGCGPGLVDRAACVPIHCVPARVPAKPPKRGAEMDARAFALESKSFEECVFYAAGVGVVQTLRVDCDEHEHEPDFAATEPVTFPGRSNRKEPPPQRHFRGHADDVRCLAVHERTRVAASGEMGLEPAAMVWSLDARSGEPPLAVLRHPRGARAIIGVAFDARGDRVATVAGDDGHTVSLWAWDAGGHATLDTRGGPRVGRVLWSARSYQTTPPAVRGVLFSPVLSDPDLLVTFGVTHVRFWKPAPTSAEADEGAKPVIRERKNGSGEKNAPTSERAPWRARAGKNLRVEDVCSGVFLDWCSAVDGSDALRARAEGVHAIPHLDEIPAAEEGLRRGAHFVSGTPRGKLLFWENGDGSVPAAEVPGSRHRGAVQALALSLDRQRAGAPRLLLSGDAAGAVMCWAVDPLSGRVAAPLGGVFLVETPPRLVEAPPPEREDSIAPSELWLESDLENEPLDDGDGDPVPLWNESFPDVRGLSWSPSGKYYLAATAQGSVWRVDLEPEPEESDDDSDVVTETGTDTFSDDGDAVNEPRPRSKVIIRGHDSAVTATAWSGGGGGARLGIDSRFATGADSGRVVCWNAKARAAMFAFDAGGPVRSMAFSPDGNHLACGVDGGRIHVFNLRSDPTLAPPNDVQPRFHASVAGELRAAVTAVAYSPDGELFAAGDGLGNLELYRAHASGANARTYRRRAKCVGHASGVLHIDWAADGSAVRSSSTSYEVLCHEAPSGRRVTREPRFAVDARETRAHRGGDERGGWHTWTTPLGFELMGLWPKGADGTDINGVWRFGDGKHVVSADDSGCLRVLNFPCATRRAPSLAHKAHSSHVSAAKVSWCDQLVASVGGRDCCVMQWRVVSARGVPSGSAAKLNGLFELRGVSGETLVEGFDRTRLEEGVVNVKTLDADTARIARAGKVQVEASDGETSSDGGDDGIWAAERERDVAEVDDVYDDMFNDIDYVVPEQGVNKQVRTAHFALQMQQPGKPKSKLWATREEVAERRRLLETELRSLGRGAAAATVGGGAARDRAEWAPAASVGDASMPPPPPAGKKTEAAAAQMEDADGADGEET